MNDEETRRVARLIRTEIGRIVDSLESIGDALESYVYEDDEKVDTSDGVFLPQDDESDDGFADRPDFDTEDFEQ